MQTGLQPKLSEIERFVEKHLVEDTETGLKAIAHMIKTLLEVCLAPVSPALQLSVACTGL